MIHMLFPLALAVSPAVAEAPFADSGLSFPDGPACAAHLDGLAGEARAGSYEAVRGPYVVAEGDVRIHMVAIDGRGHRITEHRCLAQKLSGRSWRHSLEDEDQPFTVESVAARVEWLKKGRGQQD